MPDGANHRSAVSPDSACSLGKLTSTRRLMLVQVGALDLMPGSLAASTCADPVFNAVKAGWSYKGVPPFLTWEPCCTSLPGERRPISAGFADRARADTGFVYTVWATAFYQPLLSTSHINSHTQLTFLRDLDMSSSASHDPTPTGSWVSRAMRACKLNPETKATGSPPEPNPTETSTSHGPASKPNNRFVNWLRVNR